MIRRVQLKDIDEVMIIERQSFPVAWEYTLFLNICLRGGAVISGESGTVFMDILEQDERVIGYVVWEVDSNTSQGHLLNLAVHPDERRRGYGRTLLFHMIQDLKARQMTSCRLEVRESNMPARNLYKASGFTVSAKIPGYYFDEDAIVYTMDLQS
jgi:ribosomal-protein-alanine N-acetyltransferase